MLPIRGGLESGEGQHAVGASVQDVGGRPCDPGEEHQWSRKPATCSLGERDCPGFWGLFPKHHVEERHQEDRDHRCNRRPSEKRKRGREPTHPLVEEHCDGVFGDIAQKDRSHGDAQLGGGELTIEVLQRRQGGLSLRIPLLRERLDACAAGRNQGKLSRDEEGVGHDEDNHDGAAKQQRAEPEFFHRVAGMSKLANADRPASAVLTRVQVPPFAALEDCLTRSARLPDEAMRGAVRDILEAVRSRGDAAVAEYQRTLDGADLPPDRWEVPREKWEAARAGLAPELSGALERAEVRVRAYHERQRESGFAYLLPDGSRLGMRVLPLERVGIYIPGGQAAYPSTVLMNAIPARVAGVSDIVAITPPGGVSEVVLAACAVADVTRLFRIGGAQGIAALAFGTTTVPPVDKIVGPGNKWVSEAKRQLVGAVGIDMIAGPTEVLVVADDTANPTHVAADLLAQAEHDEDAQAWLVTTSEGLVERVEAELVQRLATSRRAAVARGALSRNGMAIIVPDLETAVNVANRRAPEHCELLVRDADRWAEEVRNAGAVFVGESTPEPVGDYIAGPSHVLPTGGTARFSSPLGVYDFVKRTSVIEYTEARLAADAADIMALAESEGLSGHAESVRIRTQKPNSPDR